MDAITRHGVLAPSHCRRGVCGTCQTTVLTGEIDHRDLVLTTEQRARGNAMMICVSRAAPGCDRIVLDL
nr:2Fe-2S iron-sulfur cluster binding domain-containing protein [Antrihabitans stalactiti]